MLSEFSLPVGSVVKNVIILRADLSSSVHIDNKIKDILIFHEGSTQRSDDTTLTPEAQYSINFSRSNIKFSLSLHCNGSNNFLFVNATKIYPYEAKDFEIKIYSLCLGNLSGDFSASNMKKKTALNGCVYDFSVDYRALDTSDIINIHKYLMKKHNIKYCLSLLKKYLSDY